MECWYVLAVLLCQSSSASLAAYLASQIQRQAHRSAVYYISQAWSLLHSTLPASDALRMSTHNSRHHHAIWTHASGKRLEIERGKDLSEYVHAKLEAIRWIGARREGTTREGTTSCCRCDEIVLLSTTLY
ncbi:uncharacterized protein MYCGRDRAFT_97623 [Zymoseptoria tritici IPO323]|uniref:Secreted protein n=1 Tax=Zymoseptoria tritici (strain CBS 115943 / IPO323) TaxID=336722 RepID=F9XR20_ZYMTI|nr:uncharacterized protein MYCGRDRAFT_97623 [Zymoseptoria tritici IPO323]EGP82365.1 hypothetical protein MYCGRDRAFT_97623 [Zymoseptoria tritici IPO323]